MKIDELKNIFPHSNVHVIDGQLSVSVIKFLDAERIKNLSDFLEKHKLECEVKPASGCLYINFTNAQ